MIIKTSTVGCFLENLEDKEVHQKEVFIDSSRSLVNEEGSVIDVTIHASAIIVYPEGGQALLLCGEYCGRDRHTGDGGLEGTDARDRKKHLIVTCCHRAGLTVKPGILDA
jgi:hypothetical protein